ncbi:Protein containing ALS2cr12 (ALS2CR12) signature [Caenorhabditis elegans]|uniref:Protein containing ALS2cr12 (ALS2CR12) signature n=1 Tax=Caenorhabditis elegans TaxID=6239 RepID=A5A8R4_CAEEL|nr:Protein containing ALS2cr12 (ALS2CR12) signature [Caenorhabditis elegans]CCD70056.2 Protein containing ALS2cr12 (ALS2CR12) signature [Caenorhabditis elegans]|eukprot:NP_001122931.2 Uncharacterized protein CELE_F26D11.13 [Caenorhabditis elegans]
MFDCIFSVISCFLLILLLKLFKKLLIEQEEAMNSSTTEEKLINQRKLAADKEFKNYEDANLAMEKKFNALEIDREKEETIEIQKNLVLNNMILKYKTDDQIILHSSEKDRAQRQCLLDVKSLTENGMKVINSIGKLRDAASGIRKGRRAPEKNFNMCKECYKDATNATNALNESAESIIQFSEFTSENLKTIQEVARKIKTTSYDLRNEIGKFQASISDNPIENSSVIIMEVKTITDTLSTQIISLPKVELDNFEMSAIENSFGKLARRN